jgi:hypothetical protein
LGFTTVPAAGLGAAAVWAGDRCRGQIELPFKRRQSLRALDELAAKDDRFCRTFFSSKRIAALLVEPLSQRGVDVSPWG